MVGGVDVHLSAGKALFSQSKRWQMAYISVFAVWAWIVVALFPVIFKYQ